MSTTATQGWPMVFSKEDAARYLNLDGLGCPDPAATVERLGKQGMLAHFVVAGRWACTRADLDACIEGMRAAQRRKGRTHAT